ncbi:Fungalysin/Thermolysin Extracellular metalloproteinase 5 [Allomyces arbusculus]|nr:Fungalysin/Thermolysin Extracellular metalloproteinase 5 [Allomyces arbusculus]
MPVRRAYLQSGNNVKLIYSYQLKQIAHWYHGHVNVLTGEIEAVNNRVADAVDPVIPIGVASPDTGPIVNVDSANVILANATPNDWHKVDVSFTDTRGNNVEAIPNTADPPKNVRTDGGATVDFTRFAPDFTKDAEQCTRGATVQLFYALNSAHDLSYQYEFDEIGSSRQFAALFLVALLAMHALPQAQAFRADAPARQTAAKVPTLAYKSFKILPPVNTLASATAATVPLIPDVTDPRDVAKTDPHDVAKTYLTDTLGFPENEWVIKNVVKTSAGVTAVYVRQLINGLEVVNGDINLNIKNGQVMSIGDSFYRGARPSQPDLAALSAAALSSLSSARVQSPVDAFKSLAAFVGSPSPTTVGVIPAPTPTDTSTPTTNPPLFLITSDIAKKPVPVRRAYVQSGNNLKLVFSYQLQQEPNWYHGHVNALTGEVEAVNDWVAEAIYPVIPVHEQNPDHGPIVNVYSAKEVLLNASPQGWHKAGLEAFTDTRGNNVDAIPNTADPAKNVRPDGGAARDFRPFAPDFTKNADQYTPGATVQLFYALNKAHDVSYKYGFDEASGNFQIDNYGKGGLSGDPIQALVQDLSGVNNAFFATPPDGESPTTGQFIFTFTNPTRDGVYDLVIPFHEFFHGVSNRLTGGPANTDCLPGGEPGGMGEGWSDIFSMIVVVLDNKTATRNTPVPVGTYAVGDPAGVRKYPYSTDLAVNPSVYSFLAQAEYQEVHRIGEVWASMLFEIYWNLVDKYGCAPLEKHNMQRGNALMLQLIMDGLKLQPCLPSFIDARTAILQADANLTGGQNQCLIWKGFAKRGLGTTAAPGVYVDSNAVPPECAGV